MKSISTLFQVSAGQIKRIICSCLELFVSLLSPGAGGNVPSVLDSRDHLRGVAAVRL